MKIEIEEFALSICKSHGFRSNSYSGFSCIIPDNLILNTSQKIRGLVLWVFSRKHQRFETQFQHYKTADRIKRMVTILKIDSISYKIQIEKAVIKYSESLLELNGFHKIGNGVKFWESTIFNIACDFSYLNNNLDSLLRIEEFTQNNPIIDFCVSYNHFDIE
jgi:hypothetical protein